MSANANCAVIDCDTLCFIKVTETKEQAEYWAEILIPDSHDYHIVGVGEKKPYSVYSEFELRAMYENFSGTFLKKQVTYPELIALVAQIPNELPVDETSVADLREKLGRDLTAIVLPLMPAKEKPSKASKAEKASQAEKAASWERREGERRAEFAERAPKAQAEPKPASDHNGRPKAGTATGTVWETADALQAQAGEPPERAVVIEACVKKGINAATASTQYGKWRKSLNLTKELIPG